MIMYSCYKALDFLVVLQIGMYIIRFLSADQITRATYRNSQVSSKIDQYEVALNKQQFLKLNTFCRDM